MNKIRITFLLFHIAAVILLTPVLAADTPVSGTINEDTTWTESGSPYIAGNHVVVADGVTLTIEPGCIIKFSPGINLSISGRVIADGTPEKPIIFMRYEASNWGNIRLQSADPGCLFDSCRIFGGQRGIQIYSSSPGTPATISNCLFYDIYNECIDISNSAPIITGCTIIAHRYNAIKVYSSDASLKLPSFSNCSILKRGAMEMSGIEITMSSQDNFQALVENCRISNFQKAISIKMANSDNNMIRIIACDLKNNNHSVSYYNTGSSFDSELRNCRIGYIFFDDSSDVSVPLSPIEARENFWTLEEAGRSNKTDQISFIDDRATDHFPGADLNDDDVTDSDDAAVIMDYLVGNQTLPDEDLADADGDGDVDIRDASLVRSYGQGLLWKLPKPFLP